MPMSKTDVKVEVSDLVARVTIDRPPVNALDWAAMDTLTNTFDRLGEMSSVKVVVFTGAGKIFCAGSDMKARAAVAAEPGDTLRYQRTVRGMLDGVLDCRVPVIAAVNGAALGSGLALTAVADLVVASTTASFGLPEIDVGLLGGGQHATRFLGHRRARRALLTGYRYTAAELFDAGVLEWCVAPEELESTVMELARVISSKSPAAVRLAKRSLNTVEHSSLRDGYRIEQEFTTDLTQHPDSIEAMTAFRERRSPNFD
jgi:enoyl-CoA hydratase/carnithine racemase